MTTIVVQIAPELVRPEVAEQMLGGGAVLTAMRKAKWLAPVHQARKMTLYSVAQIREAAARLSREELVEL